jgi:hypothetical protein
MRYTCGLGFVELERHKKLRSNVNQANVMLSYPIDEAEELLTTRLATAKLNLSNCEEDLDFLREQITVSRGTTAFWGYKVGYMSIILTNTRPWKLLQPESIIGM